MVKIKVADLCPFALAEDDGAALYDKIDNIISNGEPTEVDFEGIALFATPFFNTSIGRVILNYGVDRFDSLVKVVNLDELGIETYEHSRANAISYIEKKQSSQGIEKAVLNNIEGA